MKTPTQEIKKNSERHLTLGEQTNCFPIDIEPLRTSGQIAGEQIPLESANQLVARLKAEGTPDQSGKYEVPGFEGITVDLIGTPQGSEYPIIRAEEGPEGLPGVLDPQRAEDFKALLGETTYAWYVCRAAARAKGIKTVGFSVGPEDSPRDIPYSWALSNMEFMVVDSRYEYVDSSTGEIVKYTSPFEAVKQGDFTELEKIGTYTVSEEGLLSWIDQDGNIKITGNAPEEVAKLQELGYTEGDWKVPLSGGVMAKEETPRIKKKTEEVLLIGMRKRGEKFTLKELEDFYKTHPDWSTPLGPEFLRSQ